jgi:hypothetical protein
MRQAGSRPIFLSGFSRQYQEPESSPAAYSILTHPCTSPCFFSEPVFLHVVLFLHKLGSSEASAINMAPLAASRREATDDEIAMEKNAGLIMGVSILPHPVPSVLIRSEDKQQQYSVKEKCGKTISASTTFLSLLCQEASAKSTTHQPWILAPYEGGRLGRQTILRKTY